MWPFMNRKYLSVDHIWMYIGYQDENGVDMHTHAVFLINFGQTSTER